VPIPGATKPPEGLLGTYAPRPPPTIEQLGFSTFDDYPSWLPRFRTDDTVWSSNDIYGVIGYDKHKATSENLDPKGAFVGFPLG
jgi:hypothetical protein